ncbi:hypothetical protein THAOC_17508, partial [Thalassiosira oceanica]
RTAADVRALRRQEVAPGVHVLTRPDVAFHQRPARRRRDKPVRGPHHVQARDVYRRAVEVEPAAPQRVGRPAVEDVAPGFQQARPEVRREGRVAVPRVVDHVRQSREGPPAGDMVRQCQQVGEPAPLREAQDALEPSVVLSLLPDPPEQRERLAEAVVGVPLLCHQVLCHRSASSPGPGAWKRKGASGAATESGRPSSASRAPARRADRPRRSSPVCLFPWRRRTLLLFRLSSSSVIFVGLV